MIIPGEREPEGAPPMINSNDTWQQVDEKLAELRRLTNNWWANEEWELAALGERTIKTVEASRSASAEMRVNMAGLARSTRKLKTVTDGYRCEVDPNYLPSA
jgi:hypothetical protein